MNEESTEVKQKTAKVRPQRPQPDVDADLPELPKIYDKDAMHKKVIGIMIGLFVLILLAMVLFQSHLDFAASGGM